MTPETFRDLLHVFAYTRMREVGVIQNDVVGAFEKELAVRLRSLPGWSIRHNECGTNVGMFVHDFASFFEALLDQLEASDEQRAEIMTAVTLEMLEDG